jgi:hypothetical protein
MTLTDGNLKTYPFGNLEALQAVLADAQSHRARHYICLGDLVGYNASPRECVEIVRGLNCPVVKGNRDEYACYRQPLAVQSKSQKANSLELIPLLSLACCQRGA